MDLHEDKDEDEDDTRILGICINEWHRLFLRQRKREREREILTISFMLDWILEEPA